MGRLIQSRPGHHQETPITAEPVAMMVQGWHHQGLSDQNGGWSAEGFEFTGGVQGCEVVVAANHCSVDEHLREGAHAAAALAGSEIGVVVDGDHRMGQCQGAQQPKCAAAPGTSRQYSDFKPWRRRCRWGFSLDRSFTQHPDQHIDAFLHQCSRLEMTAPHLASSIGKAEMKMPS